jgi:DNA polymerase-3 subunit epsilon
MSWLARVLGTRPALAPAQERALAAYREAPKPDRAAPAGGQRLVVVDVETSGLDARKDRLLAIGAIGVRRGAIPLRDGFEVVLRQEQPSAHENILVHGIDGTTQRSGTEPAEALARFLAYAGKAPLVAFHADFDRIMIERATRPALGLRPVNTWLDLAVIAPVVFPEHAGAARTLDDWLRVFGIEHLDRHDALADALATAQLLLVVLARAARSGAHRLDDLIAASTGHRWIAR